MGVVHFALRANDDFRSRITANNYFFIQSNSDSRSIHFKCGTLYRTDQNYEFSSAISLFKGIS
jgi:hypothetical protein